MPDPAKIPFSQRAAEELFQAHLAEFIRQYAPAEEYEASVFHARLHNVLARHTNLFLRPFQEAAASAMAKAPMPTPSIRISDL